MAGWRGRAHHGPRGHADGTVRGEGGA